MVFQWLQLSEQYKGCGFDPWVQDLPLCFCVDALQVFLLSYSKTHFQDCTHKVSWRLEIKGRWGVFLVVSPSVCLCIPEFVQDDGTELKANWDHVWYQDSEAN